MQWRRVTAPDATYPHVSGSMRAVLARVTDLSLDREHSLARAFTPNTMLRKLLCAAASMQDAFSIGHCSLLHGIDEAGSLACAELDAQLSSLNTAAPR
jgi:hypothetical protein